MPRFCTKCGAELLENARFCRQCGAAVQPSQATANPPAYEPTPSYSSAPLQAAPASAGSYLQRLEQWLNVYLIEKAPPLQPNWKDGVVKVAPWVTLVSVVVSLPFLLAGLGLGMVPVITGIFGDSSLGYALSTLLLLGVVVLRGLSLPGLFNRTSTGWRLAYYATLVNAAYSLLHFRGFGLLLNGLSLYLLFQVRSYYRSSDGL